MPRTHFNPERRAWRGRSYRKGGARLRDLRVPPLTIFSPLRRTRLSPTAELQNAPDFSKTT